MIIAALFKMAKIWKQPKCPPTGEWIKKIQHIYMHIYVYSHTHAGILLSHKKNEIMPFAATWRDLEITVLSEVNQKEKDIYHMSLWYGNCTLYMCNLKNVAN